MLSPQRKNKLLNVIVVSSELIQYVLIKKKNIEYIFSWGGGAKYLFV